MRVLRGSRWNYSQLPTPVGGGSESSGECSPRTLAQLFERIDGFWVEGAELPPADIEAAIDDAARAGDGAALADALAAYEAAAWASCVAAGGRAA